MNFQNVNPLNDRMNKMTGNLLPMTSDDRLFPLAWRIYSVAITLFEIIEVSAMIPGILSVPFIKVLDGIIPFIVLTEMTFFFVRMQMHRSLITHVIGKLNNILLVEDKTMERIVKSIIKSVETPLKYFWVVGCGTIIMLFAIQFFDVIFTRDYFFYEDYKIPMVISRQPFSKNILILGDILGCVCASCIFVRKNALDIYMINIMLLMTAQYHYIATKLAILFREGSCYDKTCRKICDKQMETEIKALCRRHSILVQITPLLQKLLSNNTTFIYLTNVFRFCFLGCMTVTSISSLTLPETTFIILYAIVGIVQLYILCSCMQRLLEASTETTDEAFHEKWYQFEPSLKRTFLLMMMGNSLECKLSTFEMFSLTLPSFMTIMNQAYSIALLIMRVK